LSEKILLKCGLDEAGRGPIAGPVSAGCVILPSDFPIEILNDSKKISEKKRDEAEKIIKEKACWGIAFVDHKKIDEINVLQASLLAMKLAYEDMMKKLPDWLKTQNISEYSISAMTDGNFCPEISNIFPEISCEVKAEPKADGNYPEVMAASIIAKVGRDRLMLEYDALYPEYGYAVHKGYPTSKHLAICRKIGVSPIQRLSFDIRTKEEKAAEKKALKEAKIAEKESLRAPKIQAELQSKVQKQHKSKKRLEDDSPSLFD